MFRNTKKFFLINKLYFILAVITFIFTSCGKTQENFEKNSLQNKQNEEPLSNYDIPLYDPTIYKTNAEENIKDSQEREAITYKSTLIKNKKINYKVTTGHLTTIDIKNSEPNAKIFYISYTEENIPAEKKPVTFLYNGGPGSAAVWIMLGSFAPKRIKTSMPDYTPPAPYILEDNPESLLDKTDLVFINPVGTGYSSAIAPYVNKDFWGVDKDANSICDFIIRYISKFERWNSPKYLMGESYGTIRSAITGYFLHKRGIDLNGITLISSVLDFSKWGNQEGLFPTFAANAWYHKKALDAVNLTLPEFMDKVKEFSKEKYAPFMTKWMNNYYAFYELLYNNTDTELQKKINSALETSKSYNEIISIFIKGNEKEIEFAKNLTKLIQSLDPMSDELSNQATKYIGLKANIVKQQSILPYNDSIFYDLKGYALNNLLANEQKGIGIYDGRATGLRIGIIKDITDYLTTDPSLINVQAVYTALWNEYLNKELKYRNNSYFQDLNSAISEKWDYTHIDPTNKEMKGFGKLYTGGDLAATMLLNPYLKVFQASGYYDAVTPFNQTRIDLENLPINSSFKKNLSYNKDIKNLFLPVDIKNNIEIHDYPSGHMIYLDPYSRIKMKEHLSDFYDKTFHATIKILNLNKIQK